MATPTPPPQIIGWVNADELVYADDWAETTATDDLLDALHAAYEQCALYGPLLNSGRAWTTAYTGTIPHRFARAQKMQARALLRAGYTGTNDEVGMDGMTVTVWPMDRSVKLLLRPRRAFRRGPR